MNHGMSKKLRLLVLLGVVLIAALLVVSFYAGNSAGPAGKAESLLPRRTPTPIPLPCSLWASASRTRGTISLSWSCTSTRSLSGYFLVERSTNKYYWYSVSTCNKWISRYTTRYSCSDTRLTSGRTYYYRLCQVPSSRYTWCGTDYLTSTVYERAP
jgi:hypothetical protein